MRALCITFLLLVGTTTLANTWGAGSFENDDALAWAHDCGASNGIGYVKRTLEKALAAEYIETPAGATAMAAAEVVAAALGNPSTQLPAELSSWVERQPLDALAELAPTAKKVLARLQDPSASELQQLNSESESSRWLAAINDLDGRLGGDRAR